MTFKNKGTVPIRKTVPYNIFVNRIQVYGSFLQANLEPGQEETVGAGPAGYQLIGTAQIEANIDLSNSLGESKKTLSNNKLRKKLACRNTMTMKTVRKKQVL